MTNTICVHFLDADYTFPADILVYVAEHHSFEKMRQEFLSFMLSKFSNYVKMPDNTEKLFDEKTRYFADICVKKTIEHGIYDITAEDYLAENKGVAMFREVLKGAMLERANSLLEEMEAFSSGAQQAEAVRDSKVTGMGFSVLSNSIIGLGVWAAMEEHELQKQGKQADAEFRATLDAIERQSKKTSKNRMKKYAANTYLPAIKKTADVFIVDLFETYINKLIAGKAFDPEALKYNNITRAESILSNYASAKDKKQLITTAFMQCPYCVPVYLTAINLKSDIHSTLSTAKSFGVLETITHILHERCTQTAQTLTLPEAEVITKLADDFEVLAIIHNQTTEDEANSYLQCRRAQNMALLKEMASIEWCSKAFDSIMREVIHKDARGMLELRLSIDLRKAFTDYLTEIMHGDTSAYYSAAKRFAVGHLVDAATLYLDKANEYNIQHEQALAEFKKYEETANAEIEACTAELNSLWFFSKAKKNELRQRIEELEKSIDEHKQNLRAARKKLKKMFSQGQ